MKRDEAVREMEVYVDNKIVEDGILKDLNSTEEYHVLVKIPLEG